MRLRHFGVFWAFLLLFTSTGTANGKRDARGTLESRIEVQGVSNRDISDRIIGTNMHVGYERDVATEPKINQLIKPGAGRFDINTFMVDRIREAGIRVLRFPGGCTSDAYHWGQGIGLQADRPEGRDEYGTRMANYFGTLEAWEVARRAGAELILTVNYKTGTAQEAANWVEYCNGVGPVTAAGFWREDSFTAESNAPKGYFAWLRGRHGQEAPLKVKYWEVGNEIRFHQERNYIAKAKDFSSRMKARDPGVQVGLCCDSFLYMDEKALQSFSFARESFDFFVVHYYGSVTNRSPVTEFFSNGESTREFVVERAGGYELAIEARGTKALEWPRMSVLVNGFEVGQFVISSDSFKLYLAKIRLDLGKNNLTIRFTNDLMIPGVADRNLYVRGVSIAAEGSPGREVWNTPENEYRALFANNQLIENHVALVRRVFPDMPLAVTEGNAGYGINPEGVDGEESRKLKAAIWVGGLLNTLIRTDVRIFNQWTLHGKHMGFALVLPDGHVTPTFWVLAMYSRHMGRSFVPLGLISPTFDAPLMATTQFEKAVNGVPYLDAIASIDQTEGEVAFTVINRSGESLATSFFLGGLKQTEPQVRIETLSAKNGEGLEASNEVDFGNVAIRSATRTLGQDSKVNLDPFSITTLTFKVQQ